VIRQHAGGTCDVRLLYDLDLVVQRACVQPFDITLGSDTSARMRAYGNDAHHVASRHTEGETHVSRHATSTAMVNEGAAGGSERKHDDD
jgi:hypothetical protein